MKRLGPESPVLDGWRLDPQGAAAAVGRRERGHVAYQLKDPSRPSGTRWQWTRRTDEPLPGTPEAPGAQRNTFHGVNHPLLNRVRRELETTNATFEEALQRVLETIPLSELPSEAVRSGPVWNLGLGRRLGYLSPEARDVAYRLAGEVPDLERLVAIAEDVTT